MLRRLLTSRSHAGWWNRLTASKKKLNWLKIDFDKWPASLSEDEAGRDDGEPSSSPDGGGAPHATSRLPAVDLARLKKIYLLVYNVWQLLGFLYIVGLLSIDYLRHGPAAFLTTYQRVGNALKFCQLMQILEVPTRPLNETMTIASQLEIWHRARQCSAIKETCRAIK